MRKNSILDIGIATVRESCKTNMFDIKAVQFYAFKMGFFELVSFLDDEKNSAITLMNSIDYESCPTADWEYLLEAGGELQARRELEEDFMDEIKDYKENEFEFIPLPFTLEEAASSSKKGRFNTDRYILLHPDTKHPLSHSLCIKEYDIYWFKDGFYTETAKGIRKTSLYDVKQLREIISSRGYGKFTETRFKTIEQKFAIKELLG